MEYINGNKNIVITGCSSTTTGYLLNNPTTSTCTTLTNQYDKKLEGVEFIENEEGNFMEITYSHSPTVFISYSYGTSNGKYMSKERYGVVDGKINIIKTIKGIETPGYYVEPNIEWEE